MEVHEPAKRGGEEIILQDLPISHDHAEVDARGRELGGMLGSEAFRLTDDMAGRASPGSDRVGLDFLTAPRRAIGLRVHGHDDDIRQGGDRAESGQRDLVGAEQHQTARRVRRGGGGHGGGHFRA